jgi:tRNA (cmo5U34)-methyltransferase
MIRTIEMPYKAQVEISWACWWLGKAMRADGERVTFSGEGSDELWASYGVHGTGVGVFWGVQQHGWYEYRRRLFTDQHRKNFARCNKIFMANGIECRLPFLSTGLVELGLGFTETEVRDGRAAKAVLTRGYGGRLPLSVTGRRRAHRGVRSRGGGSGAILPGGVLRRLSRSQAVNDEVKSSLGHMPIGKWAFDPGVTSVFDDMISRSIPQYETMRSVVQAVAWPFLDAGFVLDLGCSTGLAIQAFAPRCARVLGIEISESMLETVRQRFVSYANVEIRKMDLRHEFPAVSQVEVALAVLTLQFIPVEHRDRVVSRTFRALRPGGAFIVVEKVLAKPGFNDLFVELYHRHKLAVGYTQEEVDRKALALEGCLVPLTESANVEMLRGAGFSGVECCWRWLNFAAWVAIK